MSISEGRINSKGSNGHYFLHGSSARESWLHSSESWRFKIGVVVGIILMVAIVRQF